MIQVYNYTNHHYWKISMSKVIQLGVYRVMGVIYHDFADPKTWSQLTFGLAVQLQPEPDNIHDHNAVILKIGHQRLGYVARTLSELFTRLLDQPDLCSIRAAILSVTNTDIFISYELIV